MSMPICLLYVCLSARISKQELSSYWDGRPFGHVSRHGPKSCWGLLCPFLWGELGPHLTQHHLGRGYNRDEPKSRAAFSRKLGPYLTQCGLGRVLRPYQVASWSIRPFGHNTPTLETDWQTDKTDIQDRQRSHSIERNVLQTVARKSQVQTSRDFLCVLPVAVARSSSDDTGICYVFPVLWMTSCFPIMGHTAPGAGWQYRRGRRAEASSQH